MTQDDERRMARLLDKLPGRPSDDHDRAVLAAADRLLTGKTAARRPRWRIPAALAASVLLAVPLGLSMLGEPAAVATRGGADAIEPANDSHPGVVPHSLSWPPIPGASGYRVVLRDAAAVVFWRSDVLTEARIVLPDAVRQSVRATATCIWSVEVMGATGQQEFGPYRFHPN